MPGLGTNKPKITDMKKPNITDGEWAVVQFTNPQWDKRDTDEFIMSSNSMVICDILSEDCVPESKANAKAISAVPNLLDDAIRKYNWMIRLKFTHPHLVPDEEIEQTYQALKKAGCYE